MRPDGAYHERVFPARNRITNATRKRNSSTYNRYQKNVTSRTEQRDREQDAIEDEITRLQMTVSAFTLLFFITTRNELRGERR